MGLLESVLGALGAKGSTGKEEAEMPATEGEIPQGAQRGGMGFKLVGLVAELIQAQGGIQGLMEHFNSKGLGQVFASWVGTQQNQEISPDQIQHAVGHEQLAGLAQKFGIDPGVASQMLSQYLPKIVDRATPSGQVEPHRDLAGLLAGLLKGDPEKQP